MRQFPSLIVGSLVFRLEDISMVICPIALVVHCKGCPIVKFCPAKTIIGDYGKLPGDTPEPEKTEEPPKDESAG
jgi:hypothetical protein